MKSVVVVLLLLFTTCWLPARAWAELIGFQTDAPDHLTISPYDQNTLQISFGEMKITNASYNGSTFNPIVDAKISLADVYVDLSSKQVLGTMGAHNIVYYLLLPGMLIADGFSITINNEIVLTADLVLYDLYLFGKTGVIDAGVQINVDQPMISTNDPILNAYFTEFAGGGDLNISFQDTQSNNISQKFDELTTINGILSATFSGNPAIPEPLSGCMMLFVISCMVGKKLFRKIVS